MHGNVAIKLHRFKQVIKKKEREGFLLAKHRPPTAEAPIRHVKTNFNGNNGEEFRFF